MPERFWAWLCLFPCKEREAAAIKLQAVERQGLVPGPRPCRMGCRSRWNSGPLTRAALEGGLRSWFRQGTCLRLLRAFFKRCLQSPVPGHRHDRRDRDSASCGCLAGWIC